MNSYICYTKQKQKRQQVDSQKNITFLKGKIILTEIMEHNSLNERRDNSVYIK